MSARPTIPTSFDEIDAAWLSAALGEEVATVDVEPFGAGTAFLGRLARVAASTAGGELRLVAKLPTDDPGGLDVGRMLGVWQREHLFYERLRPRLGDAVPDARVNLADPAAERWCLLLDDLSPAAPGDQVAGATVAQAEVAVDRLAAIHAPFWGRARTADIDWLPGIDQPRVTGLQEAWEAALPRFVERFGPSLPSEPTGWLVEFVPRCREFLAHLATTPLTVAHADYRVENLLFGDRRVWVIDWQTAMLTSGVTDLAFFLATNLAVEDRRAHETALIDRYRTGLAAHGVDERAQGDIEARYRESLFWWMGMLATNLSTIEPEDERGEQLFDAMLQRLWSAVLTWGRPDW